LVASSGAASTLVAVAIARTNPAAIPVAALCAQATLAMTAAAVRQWRFVPRRRITEGMVLVGAAVASAAATGLVEQLPERVVAASILIAFVIALVVALPLYRVLGER
jgi:hypothetical protein